MALPVTNSRAAVMLMGVAVAAVLLAYGGCRWSGAARPALGTGANAKAAPGDASGVPAARERDSVDLSDAQLAYVKVEPVEERDFPVEKEAVGSIDFNEDMAVQVFTPYPGRIIALYASVGDDVKKGQTLFTIDSPDLLQAESTLIAASGVLELTTRNLARLKELYTTRAGSQFYLRKLAKHDVRGVSITQPVGDESEAVHAMMRKGIALFDEYQSQE